MTRRRIVAVLTVVAAVLLSGVASPPGANADHAGASDFHAVLNGAQEVPAVVTAATGTGTVVVSADESTIFVKVSFSGLSTPAVDAHIHIGPPGEDGGVVFPLSFPAATSTSVPMTATFSVTPAQLSDLRAGNWYFNIHSGNHPGGEIRGQILATSDPLTDLGVYRASTGAWLVAGGPITGWGTTGDVAVPGDYNGDGHRDVAVFRPSTGVWFVQGGVTTAWGTSGDIPVPGDYDGDGDTDVAVFRPSSGVWFVQGGATVAWGTSGDIPVPGDYDGDGDTDVAVFRPSSGVWFVQGGATVAWGTSGDIPVPGDYDGDGDTDVAVFRPSSGVWFVQGGATVAWGTSGDIPVPGDYDGDGDTDVAVFRPSSGVWFFQGGATLAWGTSGDEPLALPYAIRQAFL